MAARAVGADDLLFLGLHQVLHRALVLGRPAVLGHAVEQHDVDVVDAQFHAIALEVAARVGDVGRVGLGLDDVLVAGHALEGFAQIGVRAVLVGDVEEADALVERVADDPGETLDAQPGLVARLARADAAGSHADQRDLDAGLAQRDLVGRTLGKSDPWIAPSPQGGGGGRCGQCGRGCCLREELAAIQGGCHQLYLPGSLVSRSGREIHSSLADGLAKNLGTRPVAPGRSARGRAGHRPTLILPAPLRCYHRQIHGLVRRVARRGCVVSA